MGYYIVYFVEYIIIKELCNIIFFIIKLFIIKYVFVINIVLGDVILFVLIGLKVY